MKKIVLVLLVAYSALFAQEVEVRNLDRMKNMQHMETALSMIQKGFLFDNIHVVTNGVKDLKVTALHTESFIKEGVTKEGFNTLVYAHKQAEDISKLADEVLATFEKGDRYGAANNYLKILSKCLSCHQTVRSW